MEQTLLSLLLQRVILQIGLTTHGAGLNISVDKVDIIKVSGYKDYSDDEYQGFAVVHYNIDNTQQDVTAYPEQADVSTNTGLQTSGNYEMEHFAGDLMKGTKTSGYAAYPLKELNDVNDIKSLRINFRLLMKLTTMMTIIQIILTILL
ncbi:hypothetical protein ICE98_00935 [Lactococcus lactis]|nr:hypothetical protein [Lactococcus lactis]